MSYIGTTEIGKMFLGDVEIDKAYLGSILVYQGDGGQPINTIPYIRGGADGSYIDTGIIPDNNTRVIVWARNWNPSARMLFGSNDSSQHFWISAHNNARVGLIGVAYGAWASPYNYSDDVFSKLSGYHKYELYQGVLKIDGVSIYTNSNSFTGNSNNIYLFGRNNSGVLDGLVFPADICACQIYKNGTLVRDYTAVETPSLGLYDSVSDTVFTNAGSGSFTYGTFNPDAYSPLEYIQCNKASYFNSGIQGSYSLGIVAKFRPTGSTARWHRLLGYRTSTGSCEISLGTATSGQDNMRVYWYFGANATSGQAFSGSTSNKLTGVDTIAVKSNAALTIYKNNSQIGTNSKSGVSSSFTTNGTMYVGTGNNGSTASSEYFEGRIYYLGFGDKRNFVPAVVNGVVGMYDTYHDVFYSSLTSTPFVAGTAL